MEEIKKINRNLNQENKNKEKYKREINEKIYSNQNGMDITYSWVNEWAEFAIRKAAKKSNCTTFRRNKPKTNNEERLKKQNRNGRVTEKNWEQKFIK